MHPEFKAYVEGIAPGCAKATAARNAEAKHWTLLRAAREALSLVKDFLDEIGPYRGDLRGLKQVRSALEQCRPRRQAIGFHGLL